MISRENPHDLSSLIDHYENCLDAHGVTACGVDWPNAEDMHRRYQVMLELIDEKEGMCSVLDLGCGPGLFLDYLNEHGHTNRVNYAGIDISQKMIDAAKQRFDL